MNSNRIKELQESTAYPNSISVKQALLQVWNECQQECNIELKQKQADVEDLVSNGTFKLD